ncbi:MAG: tyrosine-type recombinase/integrase [Oscillospiraceae bacterium]|nr:tyrosine-type recombinase/integrase [Oscillospiraceae bacterium]
MERKKIVTITPRGEKTLEEAFEQFVQSKRVMNISEETIKHYLYAFRYFEVFFGESRRCEEVSKNTVFEYLAFIKENKPNVSQKTTQTYIKGLRTILYYMMENGWVEEFKIKLPRAEETIKEVYTEYEIQRLIKKPNIKTCTFAELRNWAIVCYFLATGNRLGTVVNIKIGDVNLQENEILIRKTKQKKQYILPISTELKTVLREYLQYRKGTPDEFLFVTVYGEQFTKDTMGEVIRLYNNSRGVEKTGIHLFRHTFARNWILTNGDIFRLQKILGHSTLDMVKQYVAIYGADLKRDYDQHSLLDNVKANSEPPKKQGIKMR